MGYPQLPTPTGERSSHRGNCHCGAVRYTFTLSPPLSEYPAATCNCSICTKSGYLLVHPNRENFKLESGQELLKDYRFGERKVRHQFCTECGSSLFINPPEAIPFLGVNVSFGTSIVLQFLTIFRFAWWRILKLKT